MYKPITEEYVSLKEKESLSLCINYQLELLPRQSVEIMEEAETQKNTWRAIPGSDPTPLLSEDIPEENIYKLFENCVMRGKIKKSQLIWSDGRSVIPELSMVIASGCI